MGADTILGSKRGQNGAKSVKMGLKRAKKTCFDDFSAIVRPTNPVPTPGGANRIVLCVYNSCWKIFEQKADIYRDFMAAEVLESAGPGTAGIGPMVRLKARRASEASEHGKAEGDASERSERAW